MATSEYTSVQVLAARLRVKADQRLKRPTPAAIETIANSEPSKPAATSAA